MRTAFVCLLSLVLSAAIAHAAPAPLPKTDRNPSPTTEQVSAFLSERHHLQVESIQAREPRRWVVVANQSHYSSYSGYALHVRGGRRGSYPSTVYLVTYAGKDGQDRPQFTVVDLERSYRGQR